MARNGTYYLGRVLKLGSLTQATLMQALSSPRPIQSRGGNWALVNVHLDPDSQFVFGRLVDRPEFCRHSVAALRVTPLELYR